MRRLIGAAYTSPWDSRREGFSTRGQGATMLEPAWLTYAGAITGIVGAVTGVAGAIMGYVAYRRSEELKALDLRLELRKSESELRSVVEDLQPYLEHAKKSHTAVAAAAGMSGSGALTRWVADWEADVAAVRSLATELPRAGPDYSSATHSVLETKLVEVYAMRRRADRLREKYEVELAADDRTRDQIRAAHAARRGL
jgi:hypothetical protein